VNPYDSPAGKWDASQVFLYSKSADPLDFLTGSAFKPAAEEPEAKPAMLETEPVVEPPAQKPGAKLGISVSGETTNYYALSGVSYAEQVYQTAKQLSFAKLYGAGPSTLKAMSSAMASAEESLKSASEALENIAGSPDSWYEDTASQGAEKIIAAIKQAKKSYEQEHKKKYLSVTVDNKAYVINQLDGVDVPENPMFAPSLSSNDGSGWKVLGYTLQTGLPFYVKSKSAEPKQQESWSFAEGDTLYVIGPATTQAAAEAVMQQAAEGTFLVGHSTEAREAFLARVLGMPDDSMRVHTDEVDADPEHPESWYFYGHTDFNPTLHKMVYAWD
jgi:hypothetical protein